MLQVLSELGGILEKKTHVISNLGHSNVLK